MEQINSAGGIVLNPEKQVLVITNQVGKHTFPKGSREKGEAPKETALREIAEESGLIRVEIICYLGILSRKGFTADNSHTPSVIKHIDMFYCITDQMELSPIAEDAVDAQWVDPNNLRDTLTWPEEFDFFEQHKTTLGL